MGQVLNTNYLVCTWSVRMKEEDSIKEEGSNGKEDQKLVRESIVATWTISVTIFNQYILEYTSSDCAEDKII